MRGVSCCVAGRERVMTADVVVRRRSSRDACSVRLCAVRMCALALYTAFALLSLLTHEAHEPFVWVCLPTDPTTRLLSFCYCVISVTRFVKNLQ